MTEDTLDDSGIQCAPLKRGNIAVVTMHSPEYKELANITIYDNKANYCLRHDYDLYITTAPRKEYDVPTGHSGGLTWDRLQTLLNLIKEGRYQWLYAVGADTLITNFAIRLEDIAIEANPSQHLVIACDVYDFNADSFLLRCSPQAAAYLRHLLNHFDEYKNHVWVEQAVMVKLKPKYESIIKVVPQRVLNSYDYSLYPTPEHKPAKDCDGNDGQWQKGDFLIHWPGLSLPIRLEQAKKYQKEVIK